MTNEELLKNIMDGIAGIQSIRADELPNIDLYMDQLTTFIDEKLRANTRHPEVDKVLTKTMINNYAKNDLLPPPERKKYSKDHIILLLFIYYFKSILSIQDVQTLLDPLKKRFNDVPEDGISLEEVYRILYRMETEETDTVRNDIEEKFAKSQIAIPDVSGEECEKLQLFSFISLLSYDIMLKKMVIEKVIDFYVEEQKKNEPVTDRKKKKDKKEKN